METYGTLSTQDDALPLTVASQLIGELLAQGPPADIVYHYTTSGGLLGIVGDAAIIATDIQYLNDAAEVRYAVGLANSVLTAWSQATDRDETLLAEWRKALRLVRGIEVYVTSFSELDDSLAQWRGYAGRGGCALGFDIKSLQRHVLALDGRSCWVACVYDREDQQRILRDALDRLYQAWRGEQDPAAAVTRAGAEFASYMLLVSAAFKHPLFHEEKEWRLVIQYLPIDVEPGDRPERVFRPGSTGLTPGIMLPLPTPSLALSEIVIAPDDSQLGVYSAKRFLADRGLGSVQVRGSEVPYRM